jgi:hypothetical protein
MGAEATILIFSLKEFYEKAKAAAALGGGQSRGNWQQILVGGSASCRTQGHLQRACSSACMQQRVHAAARACSSACTQALSRSCCVLSCRCPCLMPALAHAMP